jgi:iron complex outermembrane recepter protein
LPADIVANYAPRRYRAHLPPNSAYDAGTLSGIEHLAQPIGESRLTTNRLHRVNRRGAIRFVMALACTLPVSVQAKDLADMDLAELVNVRISPFDVSTHLDSGYQAFNSVSASRFDVPVRDLPFAVQAFTESFIQDQKPRNIFDIARYSPGVTYRSNDFNEGNANVAIRGFTVGFAPGTPQILRDGFHGPSILDFTNISRVEVVKGPSSFLYGQVAPGGIINVITKSPQADYSATAEVTYGTGDQYRLDADLTGPAAKTLFYRLAASYDRDLHYWNPYHAHSWDIAPSLLWQPNERVSVSLKYESLHKSETPQLMQKPGYGSQSGVVPTAADPNRSAVDAPGLPDTWNSMSYADYRRSDTDHLTAWLDFKAGEHWDLRAGYSHLKYEIDALFSGNLGLTNSTTLTQGRRIRRQIYTNGDDTYEPQAVGSYHFGGTSLRLLLGAQYVERNFDNWAAQAPNNPAFDPPVGDTSYPGSPFPQWNLADPATWDRSASVPTSILTASRTDRHIVYRDRSFYGGSTFGFFADRLLVLAGLRQTQTESQLTDHLTGTSQTRIDTSAMTPQYGALYKLTPGLAVFASYAESFVPGTQALNNIDGSYSTPKPTEGRGYDLGIKADLFDRRLSGTLTFFDIRNRNIVNDFAVTDSGGTTNIYNVQSGEQRSRGVEFDTTITPTDHWQIYFSYSYMKARIVEFSGDDNAILAQDPAQLDAAGQANYKNVLRFHDAPLQMSAPHLANLWTRYNFISEGLRGLYVGVGANVVHDQTILSDTPKDAHQTYTLVNALLGYSWGSPAQRTSIELMGKNLSNEQYRPSQSSRSRPREFLLTLKAKF